MWCVGFFFLKSQPRIVIQKNATLFFLMENWGGGGVDFVIPNHKIKIDVQILNPTFGKLAF